MSTCEVRLFVLKGCFPACVSGMTVVDEIFCPPLYIAVTPATLRHVQRSFLNRVDACLLQNGIHVEQFLRCHFAD
jgi:hypothetical protein